MNNIKEKLNKLLKRTLYNELFVIEMFFFIGLFIIIFTNFSINMIFGLYFLGFIFIVYSIFLFKFNKKGR